MANRSGKGRVEKAFDDTAEYTADAAIGTKAGTRGYQIKLDTSRSCKVNVLTNDAHPEPVFRLDAAHRGHPGANVPHINVNPRISGRPDPHRPIPFGERGLQVGQQAARISKGANKVLLPVAVGMDVLEGGKAVVKDLDRGTTRNTVETAATIAGGWGGGFGGAAAGAALGSCFQPGIGTIVGGIIGGIGGGIGGSIAAENSAQAISDKYGYDIVEGAKPCRNCGERYKYRKYARKDNGLCDKCNQAING